MTMKDQIADLKGQITVLKRANTRLTKKINGHADVDVDELQKKAANFDAIDMMLAERDLRIEDLLDQINSYRALLQHTARVTCWKEL